MTGLVGLLADVLLVFAILCARPASLAVWSLRLPVQDALLAGCLLAHLVARAVAPEPAGAPIGLALAGLMAVLARIALVRAGRRAIVLRAAAVPARPVWPMLLALLAAWLAIRLLPGAASASGPQSVLGPSIGIVLAGLVGALAAHEERARLAALLLAGNGVVLAACVIAGPGWGALLAILSLQTPLVLGLRVWPDRIEP